MWKYLVELGKRGLEKAGPWLMRSGPVIGKTIDITWKLNRGIIRSPVRYFKSIVNPRSHVRQIGGASKGTIADVTPAITSAVQTRKIVHYGAVKAVAVGKIIGKVKLKTIARNLVYDAAAPVNATIHAYRFVRYPRIFLGRSSVVERGIDKTIKKYVHAVKPYNLAPRLDKSFFSTLRIATNATIVYEGIDLYETYIRPPRAVNPTDNPDPSFPVHPVPTPDAGAMVPSQSPIMQPAPKTEIIKPPAGIGPVDRKPKIIRPYTPKK